MPGMATVRRHGSTEGEFGSMNARGEPLFAEDLTAFHRRYWSAWDGGNVAAVAACLDPEFTGTFSGPVGSETLQVDRAGVLALLEASFDRSRSERAKWRRSGLIWLARGADEAAAAMRVDALFPDHPEWNNAELTIEAYRRGPDGRWRIIRAHSERMR